MELDGRGHQRMKPNFQHRNKTLNLICSTNVRDQFRFWFQFFIVFFLHQKPYGSLDWLMNIFHRVSARRLHIVLPSSFPRSSPFSPNNEFKQKMKNISYFCNKFWTVKILFLRMAKIGEKNENKRILFYHDGFETQHGHNTIPERSPVEAMERQRNENEKKLLWMINFIGKDMFLEKLKLKRLLWNSTEIRTLIKCMQLELIKNITIMLISLTRIAPHSSLISFHTKTKAPFVSRASLIPNPHRDEITNWFWNMTGNQMSSNKSCINPFWNLILIFSQQMRNVRCLRDVSWWWLDWPGTQNASYTVVAHQHSMFLPLPRTSCIKVQPRNYSP